MPVVAARALPRVLAAVASLLALWFVCAPTVAMGVGDAAPSFELPTAGGESISLEKLRGRIVYVDFWASWCTPCRRSFPWMNELQQRYGNDGFTIVAVNVDKNRADAERFLRENAARFVIAYDERGNTPLAYGVLGMPSSYLIDRRGTVVEVDQGFRDDRRAAREKAIRSLLDER